MKPTREQVAELRRRWLSGEPVKYIAQSLGWSETEVRYQAVIVQQMGGRVVVKEDAE